MLHFNFCIERKRQKIKGKRQKGKPALKANQCPSPKQTKASSQSAQNSGFYNFRFTSFSSCFHLVFQKPFSKENGLQHLLFHTLDVEPELAFAPDPALVLASDFAPELAFAPDPAFALEPDLTLNFAPDSTLILEPDPDPALNLESCVAFACVPLNPLSSLSNSPNASSKNSCLNQMVTLSCPFLMMCFFSRAKNQCLSPLAAA